MRKFFIFIIIFSVFFVPSISSAQSLGVTMPFGGQVMTIQPCNTGLLLYVRVPLKGVMPFMWLWGNLPYMMHVPPHPGQFILGMAGPVIPCVLGIVPIGAGPTIIYHGSGI